MNSESLQIIKNDESLSADNNARHEAYYRSISKVIITMLIITSGYFFFNRPNNLPFKHSFLALSIIWCGLIPSIIYLRDKNRPPFPLLPMFGFFYCVWFGVSAFNDQLEFSGGQSQLNIEAFVCVFFGLIILYSTYYLAKNTIWKNISSIKLPASFSLTNLKLILWCFLLINFFSIFNSTLEQISSINKLIQPFRDIAFGTFYILWRRRILSNNEALIIFLIIFPIEVIFLFSSGALSRVLFFLLFFLFVHWYERKNIPIVLLLCIFFSFILINPVKAEYRKLIWNGGLFQHSSFFEKAGLFGELVINHHIKNKNFESKTTSTKSDLNRLNHISEFSLVTQLTPQVIPYWNGETYKGIFTKFIPRALWPNKPQFPSGQEFGHRYGFISINDLNTSVNLQWTIEMYANFGAQGVFIGMGLIGILFALGEKKLNNPQMSYLEFVLGLTMLLPLGQPESSLVEMTGALIPITIVLYCIFHVGLRLKLNFS